MKPSHFIFSFFLLVSVTGISQQKKFHVDEDFKLQPSVFDQPAAQKTSITLPLLSKMQVNSYPQIQVVESLTSYNWSLDINRIESLKQLSYDYKFDCLGREILPEMNEFVRTQVVNQETPRN
jgi:hypothetical protein